MEEFMANTQRRNKKSLSANLSKGSSLSRTYISDLWAKPVTKYVVGGIGIAVISRLAMTVYNRYPVISEFIRENLDVVETKLTEFKESFSSSDSSLSEDDSDSLNA
jgi:hypothetical protein